MRLTRQSILGLAMFVGGGVMLYAMLNQVDTTNATTQNFEPVAVVTDAGDTTQVPLTTDIETEKRILEQKQKERAAKVAEQEQRTQQLLAEQEQARLDAMAKARAENEQYLQSRKPSDAADSTASAAGQPVVLTKPVVTTRVTQAKPETPARAQSKANSEAKTQTQPDSKPSTDKAATSPTSTNRPSQYQVKAGDGLIKLARQYDVPVEALAQANNLTSNATLQMGQTLTIPSAAQVKRLQREAEQAAAKQAAEQKRQADLAKKSEEARQKAQQQLQQARQQVKETDAKGTFGVQVALATNQARADEVAAKFKAAGYRVSTSQTSRGVRVIVGPETGKVAALALKDKINSDPKVDTTGAWVLYWR